MSDPKPEISQSVTATLLERGMSPQEAAAKATLLDQCHRGLAKHFGQHPGATMLFVPGRVEFLGKHTDYAGGRSLLCTLERGFCASFTPSSEASLQIVDVHRHQQRSIPLQVDAQGTAGHWSTYAAAVARRAALNFPGATKGVRLAFASDLPPAAGLSSSSALVVTFFLALAAENNLTAHPAYVENITSREELAGYLGSIENGSSFGRLAGEQGVGTFGGSEDHTAILCCQPGCLSQYRFTPVELEQTIPFPKNYRLLIAASGVIAEKTAAARDLYNRASLAVRALVELWRADADRQDRSLDAALTSSPDAYGRLTRLVASSAYPDFSPAQLQERLDQFVRESHTIIPDVANKIAAGAIADIGPLVDASQAGAEQQLHNQVPETIFLASSARALGAVAASSFGAGWGGSVWALAEASVAGPLLDHWRDDYLKAFPQHTASATFFITTPGPAATWL